MSYLGFYYKKLRWRTGMGTRFTHTKLVVRDVPAVESFYTAMGLKVVRRYVGGEGRGAQEQSWLSQTGDDSSHILILTRFLELPAPASPVYPGEIWVCLSVEDTDEKLSNRGTPR